MFIHNMFVLLQRGNNFKKDHEKVWANIFLLTWAMLLIKP